MVRPSSPLVDESTALFNFFATATSNASYTALFFGIGITVWIIFVFLFPALCCGLPCCVLDVLRRWARRHGDSACCAKIYDCTKCCCRVRGEDSDDDDDDDIDETGGEKRRLSPMTLDVLDRDDKVYAAADGDSLSRPIKKRSSFSSHQQKHSSLDRDAATVVVSERNRATGHDVQCHCRARSVAQSCALVLMFVIGPLFAVLLSAFQYAHWVATAFVALPIWTTGALLLWARYRNFDWRSLPFEVKHAILQGELAERAAFLAAFSLIAFAAFVIPFVTADLCLALNPMQLSTGFTRRMAGPSCAPGPACLVYLTGANTVHTQTIVNFHVNADGLEPSAPVVVFGAAVAAGMSSNTLTVASTCFREAQIADEPRHVCWADLVALSPGTVYAFRVEYTAATAQVSSTYFFRTASASGNITFVAGGDYETGLTDSQQLGPQLSRAASDHSSSSGLAFGVMAGDVCYENAMPTCYRRWDFWLREWNANMRGADASVTPPRALLVPIVTAVGNHEAGGMFAQSAERMPFYARYLPQQVALQNADPGTGRPMYHAHWLGNHTLLLVLDSGVIAGNEVDNALSAQRLFVRAALVQAVAANVRNRIVTYHYSLYPSKQNPWEAAFVATLRAAWGPLFDEFNVTLAFENHYHLFKVTHQIRGDAVVGSPFDATRTGVTYLGDGNWGLVDNWANAKADAWYIKRATGDQHVFVVTAYTGGVSVDAIRPDGTVLMHFDRAT